MLKHETDNNSRYTGSIINEIPAEQVYLACGYTDMRRSITGLAAMVQQAFKLNPGDRNLYLFCGRQSDRIKALYYEGDGYIMLYKRLESGGRFQWPRRESEARLITGQQLRWLLEGLSVEQPKAILSSTPMFVV
jgi:transposase